MEKLRWEKRLKWLRISKIVIPIALAVSLVFAGVSVYGSEAQNFVIRASGSDEVALSLSMNKDLSEQTARLVLPVVGNQTNSTYVTDPTYLYSEDNREYNIPDDIAKYYGVNTGYYTDGEITFVSFSFFLINNSNREVDVDIVMNLDGVVSNGNVSGNHIDDALRVMIVDGEPLLSEQTYTVYSKAERTEEDKQQLIDNAPYSADTVDFLSDTVIFKRTGENGIKNFGIGESIKFTVIFWLEGYDVSCTNDIFGEMAKMSIDFTGY